MWPLQVIHKFGKTGLFKKLSTSSALRKTAATFYEDKLSEEVGNACIRFFELLHSPSESLPQIRITKYEQMVTSDCSAIDPSLLPPSPRVAFYHGLRVYHQVKVWRDLRDSDYMPLDWAFIPIMTDEEVGPEDLLKVIPCDCKLSCDSNRCTRRKAGLCCTSSCKECHGSLCNNTNDEVAISDDNFDKDFDDTQFLDAFALN